MSDDRPTTTRIDLKPPQMARLEAAGWQPGSMALGEWLTLRAEDAARLTREREQDMHIRIRKNYDRAAAWHSRLDKAEAERDLAREQRDRALRERDYWAHRRRATADERVLRLAEQRDAARRERDEARAEVEDLRGERAQRMEIIRLLRRRTVRAEAQVRRYEEDCAICPEDQTVTETVTALRVGARDYAAALDMVRDACIRAGIPEETTSASGTVTRWSTPALVDRMAAKVKRLMADVVMLDELTRRLTEQRNAARRERDEARECVERLRQAALEGMLKVWVTAYNAGYHDTVESKYADSEPDDDVIHEYLVEAMEVVDWRGGGR